MIIEPRVLKGFRDFLPEQEMERRRISDLLENTFKKAGFVPIDTPVLEYEDVLLGKGGGETDKQIYRFTDHGNRNVAMRFDLTVPFARYIAAHYNELYMPFKRYHISKVWRGENTQRGRYREFMQCDFDIVGTDSVHADFEILLLMYESFVSMNVADITIRLSHRGIFNALLEKLGVLDRHIEILRAVDKLAKIGDEKVTEILAEHVGTAVADKILAFIRPEDDFAQAVEKTGNLFPEGEKNLERIMDLHSMIKTVGIEHVFRFDTSITRGLDYYTGIVYETFLNDAPEIGSVCSGGRYDNLASVYTHEIIPGVGASIGLDRLMAGLEGLGILETRSSALDVMIFNLDEHLGGYYHRLCHELRGAGIGAEVYPENRKIAQQFKFAGKKGIPFALLCGEDEYAKGVLTVKDLRKRENIENLDVSGVISLIKGI